MQTCPAVGCLAVRLSAVCHPPVHPSTPYAPTLPALFIAAAPVASLAAQNPEFHWDKTLAAGNDVHVNNINGNVKITPSTNGHVVVNGFKHGGRDTDRIKAVVEESSRGIAVCVVYETRTPVAATKAATTRAIETTIGTTPASTSRCPCRPT